MDDKIILSGMVFYGYHGVTDEERRLGQRFTVDMEVETDTRGAGTKDDITQALNYAAMYATVRDVVEGEPCMLLEAVAEQAAGGILREFPVRAVRLRVGKPAPPIPGAVLGGAAVEVYRRR